MNESEKLSLNLGVVELAQIDVLVEQGIYSNRSDFIRTAVRKELELQKKKIERQFSLLGLNNKNWRFTLGVFICTKRLLEQWAAGDGDKLSLTVVGMFVVEKDVSLELFESAIDNITIRGKIVASDEIREAIKNRSL